MKQIRKAWIIQCLGQNYSISSRNKFILREFDRFLLSHSALHDFYRNCDLKSNIGFKPTCFILWSFIWGDTSQGHMFWKKLNSKWNVYLSDNIYS